MAIYGIDLGTTYCAAATMEPGARSPVRVHSLEGSSVALPSLVFLHADRGVLRATIGAKALTRFRAHVGDSVVPPRDVLLVRGAKNYMGARGGAQADAEGAPPWRVGDHEFNATDLAAILLRGIAERLRRSGAPAMDGAVVTHPQRFRNHERRATEQAIDLSGIPSLGMLTEPDAAAWSYEHFDGNPTRPGRFLVFDFGGGTLDLTLLERVVDGGVVSLRVVDSYGIHCGGLAIDQAVAGKLIERFFGGLGGVGKGRTGADLSAWSQQEFLRVAEDAKRALNTDEAFRDRAWRSRSYSDEIHALESPGVAYPPAVLDLSLGEYCDWIRGDVDYAVGTIRTLLERTTPRLREDDIDEVRLTGQSSQLVLLRQRLSQRFGRDRLRLDADPASWLHPASIVASGAAIFGAAKSPGAPRPEIRAVQGAIPDTITIATTEGPRDLVEARSPVPLELPRRFKVQAEGGGVRGVLPIQVFEGRSINERDLIEEINIPLGEAIENGVPVDITVRVKDSGLFELDVSAAGVRYSGAIRKIAGIYGDAEMQRRRDLIRSIVFED